MLEGAGVEAMTAIVEEAGVKKEVKSRKVVVEVKVQLKMLKGIVTDYFNLNTAFIFWLYYPIKCLS